MKYQMAKYNELENGDTVMFYGYVWTVSEITKEQRDGKPCIYFTLKLTDKTVDIANTVYDGGHYGGLENLEIAKINK